MTAATRSISGPYQQRTGLAQRHSFEDGLAATVRCYLENLNWCDQVRQRAGYGGGRLGVHEGSATRD